jgi:CHAT domain-containing protein
MNTHLPHVFNFTLQKLYGIFLGGILAVSLTHAQETQPEVRQLLVGNSTEYKVTGRETHFYAVEMRRSQVLRASFQERGADLTAVVLRAAGEQKASAMSNYGSGFMRESLTLIPDQDGTYVLMVHAAQIAQDAGYVLTASLTATAGPGDVQRARTESLMEEGSQALVSSDARTALSATAKFEESARIWHVLGDRYWEAVSIASLGNAYLKGGEVAKVEVRLLQALKIFEELQDEPAIAALSGNLGAFYIVTGNEPQARPFIDRTLSISRKLGDLRGANLVGMVNSREAVADMSFEDIEKYEAEVSVARKRNDKNEEAAVWGRAMLRFGIGGGDIGGELKLPFIERAVREALPLLLVVRDRDIELQLRLGLAMCFYDLTITSEIDEVKERRNEQLSMKYLREALILARVQNNLMMQMIAYVHLNTFYDDENERLAIFFGKKMIGDLEQFRQDVKLLDKESQQEMLRQTEEVYGSLASDLLYESRLAEAHQVLNLSRDQEFFDFKLTANQERPLPTLSPREAVNEELLQGAIERIALKYSRSRDADFVSAGEELRSTFETLEKNFSVPHSAQDVARNVRDTVDMQTVLRELSLKTGRKHVALYFVENITELLLITPSDIKSFTSSMTSEERISSTLAAFQKKQSFDELMKVQSSNDTSLDGLDKLILDFLSVLSRPEYDPRPTGAQIYRTIFKARELVGNKHTDNTLEAELAIGRSEVLLWSLRGNLRYVPMNALYDADRREYLVEKFQNAVFTRARKERFLIEPKPWTHGLGFGTSNDYPGFAPLPSVVNEISAIFGNPSLGQRGLFSGRVFLNQVFTRQALLTIQQTKPSLVHIASHFKFRPGESRNSFLLLGDGNRFSLFDMQLTGNLFAGVDLLTLSACETAAQQSDADGKEVDGFAELAQRLGASSVLASLWRVNDDGISRLMREFYRLRQQNPGSAKSETLRQAQLNLLNGTSTAEVGRRRRRARPIETAAAGKTMFPFSPAIEAPYEHPYYWAPFVLFGSSR